MIVSKRRFLAAGLLATGSIATPALARPFAGAIVVDARPLAAKGASAAAAAVERALTAELASAFAGALPPGARLVVRIDGLSLAAFAGGTGVNRSGETDALEGVATLVGAGGQVLSTYPLRNVVPASSAGAWYVPGNEGRRLVEVCRNYALWLRRGIRI